MKIIYKMFVDTMNVNSSNTCMICFGKESRITLKEYMSI